MSTIIIDINNKTASFSYNPGKSLLEILTDCGYTVNAPCGGHGRCGKCRVLFTENGITKTVLACKTFPSDDCFVTLTEEYSDFSWNDSAHAVIDFKNRNGYGGAVDIGSTTVAVKVYDLSSGTLLGSSGQWNLQKSYGGDVITRIDYCIKNQSGLSVLGDTVRAQIKSMLTDICEKNGLRYSDLAEIVVVGNTVMQHIFAGLSPVSIASAPFTPLSLFDDGTQYDLYGVPVFLSPCVAGYVGGDITAGLLGTGLYNRSGRFLFIDVGTNGEIVLCDNGKFISCAVAAGPAFEGAEITCGMPASDGAVYSVCISDDCLEFEAIGGGEAKGLCGSGLLDLVACLLDIGYIDESGCLEDDENGQAVFYLTNDVFITQNDIRQLQLAKAAVSAGIQLMLRENNITCDDLDMIYLAGGFGNRMNIGSALKIGMLPKEASGKILAVGNTSLTGAVKMLADTDCRSIIQKVKSDIRYIELSSNKSFNDIYIEEISFSEVRE